jgi:ribosomal protein S18 acetylase RimI-like enzyme
VRFTFIPRSLGFRTDLVLLQLGGSIVEDGGDCWVVRSPNNPLHWWGNFLLVKAVPAYDECPIWVSRSESLFGTDRAIVLGIDGTSGAVTDLPWFTENGFHVEAQAVTTASSVHPPRHRNAECVCRPLVTDDDWGASVDLRVRCVDEDLDPVSYREYATARAATNREMVAAGYGCWFGAFLDDRLVCQMGLYRAGTGIARFQSVETDPDFRRLGLAGTLVHHVSRFGLDALGVQRLVMVADVDYFAIDLYRSVGFEVTESQLQVERRRPGD